MVWVVTSPVRMAMKHYPAEFKAVAVALYQPRPGATIKSVAEDLGRNTEALRNWIRAADGRRSGAHFPTRAAADSGGALGAQPCGCAGEKEISGGECGTAALPDGEVCELGPVPPVLPVVRAVQNAGVRQCTDIGHPGGWTELC